MCGVAGFSHVPSIKSSAGFLSEAVNTLSHRGPDDDGIFFSNPHGIGLAHTRLSILDLSSNGHQPMFSDDNTVCLVFNGELYNYLELRQELICLGFVFSGDSDTEVLLNLYLSYRQEGHTSLASLSPLFSRLNGIFAFAIWDSSLNSIILVRDPFGIKPLYFHQGPLGVHFASEIKALASLPFTIDHQSLDRYLTFLWCPGDGTPANEVRKLGPGQAISLSAGSIVETHRWYRLPSFSSQSIVNLSMSKAEAISKTQSLLRKSVHQQLVSDVPVGAFLSGGLDSSAVVAFAREIKPDICCFTIDVSDCKSEGFVDDMPYAETVAKHLGLPLEIVRIDSHHMASGLEEMVRQLDEPLADPAPLNVFLISEFARKSGIKVMLSGTGGDDLFTGYRRHLALRSETLWHWLPRPFRIGLRALTSQLPTNITFSRRLRKLFSGAHLNGDSRLVHYFRWIERPDLHALYTPTFRAALTNSLAEDPMIQFLSEIPDHVSSIDRILSLEQRFFLTDHNLIYTDKMSMATGVEVRVPFLNIDLVDYASTIPDHFKLRGRECKWILKKAMEPYLPHDVIYRPKTGFGAPLRRWLRVDLYDWLFDTLSFERLRSRGLFDPFAVHDLIISNFEGRCDATYTLFSLASIEIWCQHYIDGISLSSVPMHPPEL